MASREPIPTWPFGRTENVILYSRFHALKHKAGNKGALFVWNKFTDFLDSVMQRAPAGYVPSAYRMYFDLDEDDPTYNADTMRFAPGRSMKRTFRSPRPAKSTFHQMAEQGVHEGKLAAELAVLLVTEEGDLNQLAGRASENLESDNEQDYDDEPEDRRVEDGLAVG